MTVRQALGDDLVGQVVGDSLDQLGLESATSAASSSNHHRTLPCLQTRCFVVGKQERENERKKESDRTQRFVERNKVHGDEYTINPHSAKSSASGMCSRGMYQSRNHSTMLCMTTRYTANRPEKYPVDQYWLSR